MVTYHLLHCKTVFSEPFTDVSLVCCLLSGTQSSRPTHRGGTGYQHADAGVRGNGETNRTHPLGARSRRSTAPSQLHLYGRLQLAGQQPDPAALRADAQQPAGTAGPLCQDPSCQMWTLDRQVWKAPMRDANRDQTDNIDEKQEQCSRWRLWIPHKS